MLSTNTSSTRSHNIVDFGSLAAEIGPVVWGAPQLISTGFASWQRYCNPTSLTGGQPNFARCLAVSWAATLYTFSGAVAPDGILPSAKFTLRPSFAFSYIGSVTPRHSSSGRQPNFAAWYKEWASHIFGWTAITLGIGAHSSYQYNYCMIRYVMHIGHNLVI